MIFSGLTAIATYLLTSELWSRGAGLFAACFIAMVPGYSSRSVAGSYDNEGIAIFALQFTYYLWLKSVKSGSVFWSICTALSYFYMVRFCSMTFYLDYLWLIQGDIEFVLNIFRGDLAGKQKSIFFYFVLF